MIRVSSSSRWPASVFCRLAIVAAAGLVGLCGCEGAGVGVSYSAGGYYAPYDYDYDYGYAPWGPDYYVGPPVVVGGIVVHDHDHEHDHEHERGRSYDGGHDHGGDRGRPAPHYRAPPPSQHAPSIPTRSRPH